MAKRVEDPMPRTDVPSHIPLRSSSDDALWRRLEWEFSELRHLVEECRLETLEEAIGEPLPTAKNVRKAWRDLAPKWYDPDLGRDVRSWQLIPFVEGIDPARVQEQMDFARSLIPALQARFSSKALTAELLLDWGRFCSAAGAIQLLFFSGSTPGHRRKGSVGGSESLNRQRRWFSHYFLRANAEQKNREQSFKIMERFINSVIDGSIDGSELHPTVWFERFLNLEGDREGNPNFAKLTGAFRDLSVAQMERLAGEDAADLPPLDWEFPPS